MAARLDPYLPIIRIAAIHMHIQHAGRGWYDGHDLVGWLNVNHNAQLNAMYALFSRSSDPQMTGDQQIGNMLKKIGQVKTGDQESNWTIHTPTGTRSGRNMVSVWRIDRATWAALYPGP